MLAVSVLIAKDGRLKDAEVSLPDPFRQTSVAKIGDNP